MYLFPLLYPSPIRMMSPLKMYFRCRCTICTSYFRCRWQSVPPTTEAYLQSAPPTTEAYVQSVPPTTEVDVQSVPVVSKYGSDLVARILQDLAWSCRIPGPLRFWLQDPAGSYSITRIIFRTIAAYFTRLHPRSCRILICTLWTYRFFYGEIRWLDHIINHIWYDLLKKI